MPVACMQAGVTAVYYLLWSTIVNNFITLAPVAKAASNQFQELFAKQNATRQII
jgi:hypothetical protein